MKKVFLVATVIVFCMCFALTLTGCDNGEQLQIYVPDGAPAMAIANIIESGSIGKHKTAVTITTGENVKAKCVGVKHEADVAILPTNAAVAVCSTTDAYQLFTTNVWGLLYVIGSSNVSDLSELNGKKVASIGLGDTGERLFKRILDDNNVSYTDNNGVTIEYVAEANTAVGDLMQNKCDFALVGEPAATNAINNAASNGKTLYRVFDLQQLWKTVTGNDEAGYPQASVIVKKSLLSEEGFAATLYDLLSQNNAFLSQNVEQLNGILTSAGSSLKAPITADIVERCNFRTVKAVEIKQDIHSYLSQLGGQFAGMLKDELYYDFNS